MHQRDKVLVLFFEILQSDQRNCRTNFFISLGWGFSSRVIVWFVYRRGWCEKLQRRKSLKKHQFEQIFLQELYQVKISIYQSQTPRLVIKKGNEVGLFKQVKMPSNFLTKDCRNFYLLFYGWNWSTESEMSPYLFAIKSKLRFSSSYFFWKLHWREDLKLEFWGIRQVLSGVISNFEQMQAGCLIAIFT